MIHSTAIISDTAVIADDVEIGAYTVIGDNVEIDSGTRIDSHVVVNGPTKIGKENHFYQFTSIGDDPQDKKYADEPTRLTIGDRNTVREFCTISRGTTQDAGDTIIGDDNWIMAYVHIAHDCVIGNHTIMANNAALAGHVSVADYAILGGFALIHQFCEIGEHAFVSFASHVNQSIPPYVTVAGEKATVKGINTEGLKRRGFSPDQIRNVRKAYRTLYRSGLPLEEARETLSQMASEANEIERLVKFLEDVPRGIIR